MRRHLILPKSGRLLVNTDVHGNFEDFSRMHEIFLEARECASETHWVILGDIVHGPSPEARRRNPKLYDYDDQSMEVVALLAHVQEAHPGHVHFVLGNHDWAHVGGPKTRKFYPDEAMFLESRLNLKQKNLLRRVFNDALICVVAPCGAFLSHGVPGVQIESFEELDAIEDLAFAAHSPRPLQILRSILMSYGQPEAVIRAFLETVSEFGVKQRFVIHGHDRDEDGFFTDQGWAACPVIFGAPRGNKRYLDLDLSAHYGDARSLRDGIEIKRLYAFA